VKWSVGDHIHVLSGSLGKPGRTARPAERCDWPRHPASRGTSNGDRGGSPRAARRGISCTTTAGRHPNSDIFPDDITVSRRHAQFRCLSGEFQVVDVGSLNGTYLNREPVESAVLVNGAEVQIGKFRLVFLTGPQNRRH
jgi:pSer/pThr/pTyr-binding forkhead associated (FHA) protein